MIAPSHMSFALGCYWLFTSAAGLPIALWDNVLAILAGLLPDIDHPGSALGRRLKIISVPLSALVGHRGLTHSFIATFAIGGLLAYSLLGQGLWAYSGLLPALCVGYLSHILGDMLTPSGVPLLWPSRKRFTLNLFVTGAWQERVFVGAFILLAAWASSAIPQIWQHLWPIW